MVRNQKGLTLMGFIMVLAVAGLFIAIGFKLFPAYSEYNSVVNAMKTVAKQPGEARKSIDEVRRDLNKAMYIDYVESVTNDDVQLVNGPDGATLQVTYEVRKPLIYNLDYVASFDHSEKLSD